MLAIRFNRTGKRNHASFRIVLQEHTKAPGKRHVEILGSYDPHKKTTIIKKERILYWISMGAQTSPVVTNLLIREGVLDRKKIAKKMPRPVAKEEVKAEEVPATAAPEVKATETPVAEEVKEEAKKEEVSAPVETPAVTEKAPEAAVAPEAKKEELVASETPKA